MIRRVCASLVILCLLLAGSTIPGCSGAESSGSKWSGLVRMMKVLPEGVREFQYRDMAAWRDFYHHAESLGLHELTPATDMPDTLLGQGYCDDKHIFDMHVFVVIWQTSDSALAGYLHTEGAKSYDYLGYTVWTEDVSSVLVGRAMIMGYDSDVRRCLDVVAADEASLYDNLDFRAVLDRLPRSLSVEVWAPDYDEAVAAKGRASTMALEEEGRITRYTNTYVTKYKNEEEAKAAADAIRSALERDDDTSEDDTAILDVTQEGVFLRYVEQRTEANDK